MFEQFDIKTGRLYVWNQARSSPRDTAQEQAIDVLIQYPHHPRAGERVVVVRCLQHGGSGHFVIDQPDGTRGLLPAWMTEPRAGQLATTEVPLLALEALRALRGITLARSYPCHLRR